MVGSKFPVAIDQHKTIDKLLGEAKRQLWQSGGSPRDPQVLISALRWWLDGSTSLTNITPQTKIKDLISIGYADLFGTWWQSTWFEALSDFGHVLRDDLKYELALTSQKVEQVESLLEAAGVKFGQYHTVAGATTYSVASIRPRIPRQCLMQMEIQNLRRGSFDLTKSNIDFLRSAGIITFGDFWSTNTALLKSDLREFAVIKDIGDNAADWGERIAEILAAWRDAVIQTG
ncbi:MAG: hypothetical protein ABIS59_03460 [Candidatus Saccharibacteria bacterium]